MDGCFRMHLTYIRECDCVAFFFFPKSLIKSVGLFGSLETRVSCLVCWFGGQKDRFGRPDKTDETDRSTLGDPPFFSRQRKRALQRAETSPVVNPGIWALLCGLGSGPDPGLHGQSLGRMSAFCMKRANIHGTVKLRLLLREIDTNIFK